jgi:hypothetical protein
MPCPVPQDGVITRSTGRWTSWYYDTTVARHDILERQALKPWLAFGEADAIPGVEVVNGAASSSIEAYLINTGQKVEPRRSEPFFHGPR